jgi:hypothetical protein
MDLKNIMQKVKEILNTDIFEMYKCLKLGYRTRVVSQEIVKNNTQEIFETIAPTINAITQKPLPANYDASEKPTLSITHLSQEHSLKACGEILEHLAPEIHKLYVELLNNGKIVAHPKIATTFREMGETTGTSESGKVQIGYTETAHDVTSLAHETTHSYMGFKTPKITCEIATRLVEMLTDDVLNDNGHKTLMEDMNITFMNDNKMLYTAICALELNDKPINNDYFHKGYEQICINRKPESNGGISGAFCHDVGFIFAVTLRNKILNKELNLQNILSTLKNNEMTPMEQLTKLGATDKKELTTNLYDFAAENIFVKPEREI